MHCIYGVFESSFIGKYPPQVDNNKKSNQCKNRSMVTGLR